MDTYNTPVSNPAGVNSGMSKIKWGVTVLVVAIAAGIIVWFVLGSKLSGSVLGAKTSYQAVFLTNGQVYFGKLADTGDWLQLTDIYYLQVTQPLQQAATSDASKNETPNTASTSAQTQPNIQLVKLGSELHGPEDSMNIDRDKVLFWENMKDDSKVVQAIRQYTSK